MVKEYIIQPFLILNTVPAKMFTRKVLCKANGIKKCY